jgi:hypothetical protein
MHPKVRSALTKVRSALTRSEVPASSGELALLQPPVAELVAEASEVPLATCCEGARSGILGSGHPPYSTCLRSCEALGRLNCPP